MGTYYITPIGTGTNAMGKTKYFSTMESYGVPLVAMIPSFPVGSTAGTPGAPLFTWALVYVATGTDTTAIDADATFDKLPITTLDATIGSLTPQQRSTFQSIGTKYGITSIAGLKNSDTCRTALTLIGQHLDPAFDAAVFAAGP